MEGLLQVVEGAYWRVMRSIVGNHHEVAFDSFFPVATNFGHSSPVRSSITTLLLSDTSYRVPSGTRPLVLMDDIIDNAILRAGGLPLAPPDSLAHLTMFTLRSLPCDLGGLGIRRFGGLAGEIACLRGRTVL